MHVRRSRLIATGSLFIALSALAGCKGGGGANSNTAAPAAVSNQAHVPDAHGNRAPAISGVAPTSIAANVVYAFAPQANDADGDLLSFQIRNKPNWATFNTVTGQLTGTPSAAHAGVYADIVISTSDGQSSAALPGFAITVSAPASGAAQQGATLSWTAPSENTDGTALTDLTGFIIMYGESDTALTQSVRIDNPSVATYVFDELPAGTHYFAVKAISASGGESDASQLVSKRIG